MKVGALYSPTMAEHPAINDRFNDLLFKLAKNIYDYGVGQGATGMSEPQRGWTDFDLLKNATANSAKIADLP